MNDDTDKPLNTVGDDALEARITAWVLGEASSFEAGELEKLCAEDPALGLFERRLRVLHGLVAEDFKAGPLAEWKLSTERRAKVTDLLGVAPEVEEKIAARRRKSRGPSVRGLILALAACLVFGIFSIWLIGGVGESAKRQKSAVAVNFSAGGGGLVAGMETAERDEVEGEALAQLERAVAAQKDIVEEKRKMLSQVIRQEGIIYSDRAAATRGGDSSDETEVAAREYDKLDQEKIQLESQIETLLKHDGEKLMSYASGIDLPGNDLASKVPEFQRAKQEYNSLRASGIGVRHPEMVAKAVELAAVEKDIVVEVAELRETLKAKLDLTKEQESRLKARYDSTAGAAISKGIANQTFADAKNDFETSQRLLEQLQTKQIAGSMQSKVTEDAVALNSEASGSGGPPPPPMAGPASASSRVPASGAPTDSQALAVNEPRPAKKANASGVDLPNHAMGYMGGGGIGGGSGGGVPAEEAPTVTSRSNTDFIPTVEGVSIPGIPSAPGEKVQDIVTAGNRSGDGTINRNNIDAILNNPNQGLAKAGAGTLGVAGASIDPAVAQLDEKLAEKSAAAPAARLAPADDLAGFGVNGGMLEVSPPLNANTSDSKFARDELAAMNDVSEAGQVFERGETQSALTSGVRKSLTGKDLKGRERERDSRLAGWDSDMSQAGEVARGIAVPSGGVREMKGLGDADSSLQTDGTWFGKTGTEASPPRDGQSLADTEVLGRASSELVPRPPAPAQAPATPAQAAAAAGGFDGFVDLGAPIEVEGVRGPAEARYRGATEVISGALTGTASGGLKADETAEALALSKPLESAPAKPEDETRAQLLKEVDRAWDLSVLPEAELPQEGQAGLTDGKPGTTDQGDLVFTTPELSAEGGAAVDDVRRKLYFAEGNHNLGKFDDAWKAYEDVLRVDPYNKAARRGMEKVAAARADYYRAAYDQTRAELLAEVDESPEPSATTEAKKQIALDLMSEVVASTEPFSTFSLHVSDASFKLAQAAMERGEVPAAESIRPEEFYNAFDYGDPAPASGEPVVCVTEQSAHPAFAQRNLLRIGVRTGSQGRGASTPLNLTLLLDHSGSMEREDRSAGLAMAVRQLSGLLKEGDTITVAGFSRQPRLLAERLPGARAEELNELIARTPSEGGTNLEEGLKLGEELAKRQFNPAAQNRVVLFTDGAANLGDARPEALQARIEGLRQQGIAFDAAGFGADGLNDKLLERLTRNGNGRYYIVDGPEDADAGFAKQLAGAFRPAAENVKVQVRFNPARVAKYKLIGFEEHRLKKEDFRNDAVDAAEMAAEEAGNALYQIETLPQGEGEVGEVSVRFRDVASGQMVERTWTIPYDAQAPAFDRATPSIQLAGLAAFAAEKLRAAPMADAVDFQELGQVFAGVRARYPNSQPVADLGSMIGKLK